MSDYTIAERADAFDMAEYPGYGHGAGDAVLVLCSVRVDDPVADALTEDGFWPEG